MQKVFFFFNQELVKFIKYTQSGCQKRNTRIEFMIIIKHINLLN